MLPVIQILQVFIQVICFPSNHLLQLRSTEQPGFSFWTTAIAVVHLDVLHEVISISVLNMLHDTAALRVLLCKFIHDQA